MPSWGSPAPTPPGWYPNPERADELRWWDGSTWTEHRAGVWQSPIAAGTVPANRGLTYVLPVNRDGYAIASGYLGLLSVVPNPFTSSAAIVFGWLALRRTKSSTRLGRGRAWFGIVAGALSIIGFSIAAVAVATQSSTEHRLTVLQPPAFHEPTPAAPDFPNMQVTPGVNNVVFGSATPLFEIRGTGSHTSPPLTLSTTNLIGGVENDGPVTVWIVPIGQQPHASTHPYYRNGAGDGGASAKLAAPGQFVVVVEATNPDVHWTVDIADQSSR